MPAHLSSQMALGRPAQTEARELAVVSGPRPEAIVALLVVVVLLMAIPALTALVSFADSSLIGGALAWVQETSTWLAYLAPARLVLFLPLAGLVARAQEDV